MKSNVFGVFWLVSHYLYFTIFTTRITLSDKYTADVQVDHTELTVTSRYMLSHSPSFLTAQYSPCMSCCAPAICLSVRNILITSPALLSYLALCGAVVNTLACRAHKVCHLPTTFTESIHQPVLALDSLILKLSNHRIRAVD